MRFNEDIKPITDLESNAVDLLRQVNESPRPVVITDYEALRDATSLLRWQPRRGRPAGWERPTAGPGLGPRTFALED